MVLNGNYAVFTVYGMALADLAYYIILFVERFVLILRYTCVYMSIYLWLVCIGFV